MRPFLVTIFCSYLIVFAGQPFLHKALYHTVPDSKASNLRLRFTGNSVLEEKTTLIQSLCIDAFLHGTENSGLNLSKARDHTPSISQKLEIPDRSFSNKSLLFRFSPRAPPSV
jgi:hypothetical protein